MSKEGSPGLFDQEQGRRAIRFVFEYDGDEVRLVSRQYVEALAPASHSLESQEGQQGFWVELRSADGGALYRQLLHDPMPRDVEVFSDDPEQSIARVPVERPTGVFFVLVPVLEGADHLAVVSSELMPRQLHASATELLRVPLAHDDELGAP
jgi:hypothetical protein